ncbi:hypothetical protein DQ353_09530 [Arthrobacter sp. AQ5-05]|nr:hypothetical protein DQ353_09530 [Arthrobacter sp. AQ5-05]
MTVFVPVWSNSAKEDLRAIGDSSVSAQIMEIADRDLRPHADDAIEGQLVGATEARFRRCVWASELASYLSFELDGVDEFSNQACDHCLVYRELTVDEQINLQRNPGVVIVRVISNDDILRLLARSRINT